MNRRKTVKSILFIALFSIFALSAQESENLSNDPQKLSFKEVWGYVMIGEETSFSADYPVTDIGYFVSAVSNFSEIQPVPKRETRFPDFKGRIHVVSSGDSRQPTHLLLDPKLGLHYGNHVPL